MPDLGFKKPDGFEDDFVVDIVGGVYKLIGLDLEGEHPAWARLAPPKVSPAESLAHEVVGQHCSSNSLNSPRSLWPRLSSSTGQALASKTRLAHVVLDEVNRMLIGLGLQRRLQCAGRPEEVRSHPSASRSLRAAFESSELLLRTSS